jgi:hypothetical protein
VDCCGIGEFLVRQVAPGDYQVAVVPDAASAHDLGHCRATV